MKTVILSWNGPYSTANVYRGLSIRRYLVTKSSLKRVTKIPGMVTK